MTRQEANLELLKIMEMLINTQTDMRFSQILLAYGFVKQERPAKPKEERPISWQDEFFMEPEKVLKRVKQRWKDINGIYGEET